MTIRFSIEEISNGFLVKGSFDDWEKMDQEFTLYSATLADAYAIIATKCDSLLDEAMEQEEQERLEQPPF